MELQALCNRLTDIKQTVSSQLAEDQNKLTLSIRIADGGRSNRYTRARSDQNLVSGSCEKTQPVHAPYRRYG